MSYEDADVSVMIKDPDGKPILVHLAEGGEQFPWAAHKGRVITGPPDGTRTSDGTPLEDLDWKFDRFWVIEALNENGDEVELTPELYGMAVQTAETKVPQRVPSADWD